MSEEAKAPSRLSSARVGSAKNKENESVNRAQSARLTNENETAEKVEKIDPPPVENATSNEVENKEEESLKLELNQLEGEGDNQQKTNRSQLNSARSVRNENSEQNQTDGQLTNRSVKGDENKSARNTERKNEEQKQERINSSRSEARPPSARN